MNMKDYLVKIKCMDMGFIRKKMVILQNLSFLKISQMKNV